MASSTWLGGRPSFSTMSSYSAAVSPSARASPTPGSAAVSGTRRHPREGLEDCQPVLGAGERVDGVLGVGHETEHVAGLVGHAGDVVLGAVGVVPGRVA